MALWDSKVFRVCTFRECSRSVILFARHLFVNIAYLDNSGQEASSMYSTCRTLTQLVWWTRPVGGAGETLIPGLLNSKDQLWSVMVEWKESETFKLMIDGDWTAQTNLPVWLLQSTHSWQRTRYSHLPTEGASATEITHQTTVHLTWNL